MHPGAITGTCRYDESPHLHSAYCEAWQPSIPTGIPPEVEDQAIAAIEEDPELREIIHLRMDTTLASDLLANLTEVSLSYFNQRNSLLDFLVASGYPIDWSEAPSEEDGEFGPGFPPALRRPIARRWAVSDPGGHGHSEDEWLLTCSKAAGWGIEDEDGGAL
jgi:hypothetical protein